MEKPRGVALAGLNFQVQCDPLMMPDARELERRVEHLEKADLVERLHKVEWKVYGLPRG